MKPGTTELHFTEFDIPEVPPDPYAQAREMADAQRILDHIAGSGDRTLSPTPRDVRAAIKTFEQVKRAELAALRGIEPEEAQTMSNGLREHLDALRTCMDEYFYRKGD